MSHEPAGHEMETVMGARFRSPGARTLGVRDDRSVTRVVLMGTVLAGVVLTGCSATNAATGRSSARSGGVSTSVVSGAMPGMSMGPGQSMPGMSASGASASGLSASGVSAAGQSAALASAAGKPTATALMVCSNDIKDKVKEVLALTARPEASSSFANEIYTCTYKLAIGPLVLSVQHSPNKAAAGGYFDGLRSKLGQTSTLDGLGEKAFGTPTGVAVVLKDDETLMVDATGVPAVFGSNQQKRTDLANEIASDVLGCWTGGE